MRKPLLTGVRLVGAIEAAKGAVVLLAGLGVLSLIHRDIQAFAERVVRFGHLNPASRYPKIFIDAASRVTDGRLWALAAAAVVYSIVRLVEAYGLWHERLWAEWFALVASGMYLPIEIYELFRHPSWIKAVIFCTNVAIVAYMAYAIRHPVEQLRERVQEELNEG